MYFRKFITIIKYLSITILVALIALIVWQTSKKVPSEGDWKEQLKVLAKAEFNGDLVTVKNVRNFQYDDNEKVTVAEYYDKTYNLSKLTKVWFITEPFDPGSAFSHTLLSFEFSNASSSKGKLKGDTTDHSFLALTIEGRLKKGQNYSLLDGTLHTYPLMYIPADERDVIYLRTEARQDQVYAYPLKATPAEGRALLVDMLQRMNEISVHPVWYNSIYANCTSSIAHHVNKIWPGILPRLDWQVVFTSYADKLALDRGLIDTNLSIEQAREKYYISEISKKVGRVENYSELIREGLYK